MKHLSLLGFMSLVLLVLTTACDTDKTPQISFAQVKDANTQVEVNRMDLNLFESVDSYASALNWVKANRGQLAADIYLNDIMRLNQATDSVCAEVVYSFVSNADWQSLQHEVGQYYSQNYDWNQLQQNLFKVSASMPRLTTPQVFTFNSGFNVGVYPDSAVIGLGLEWFLSDTLGFLNRLAPEAFPMYKRRKMAQKYLEKEAIKGWMLYNLFDESYMENMLEYIVFEGKVLATVEALYPNKPKQDIIGYSDEQWQWIQENETQMWKEFVKQELVYSSNQQELIRLTMDGPFTSGMSQNCPPKLGIYLGWQMVRDYVSENKDLTLPQLFNEVPAKKVLSAYRP